MKALKPYLQHSFGVEAKSAVKNTSWNILTVTFLRLFLCIYYAFFTVSVLFHESLRISCKNHVFSKRTWLQLLTIQYNWVLKNTEYLLAKYVFSVTHFAKCMTISVFIEHFYVRLLCAASLARNFLICTSKYIQVLLICNIMSYFIPTSKPLTIQISWQIYVKSFNGESFKEHILNKVKRLWKVNKCNEWF